jgi:hypothetical protein
MTLAYGAAAIRSSRHQATRLLAQACGLKVVLAPEGEAVVVTAS